MTTLLSLAAVFSLETLEWLGISLSCGAAAAALLARSPRARAVAMVVALIAAPALIAGQVWDQSQFADLRSDPAVIAIGLGLAVLAVAATGTLFVRRPVLVPLVLVAALPFRVPIEAGGTTVNILAPLYLAIAGAVAAYVWTAARKAPGKAAEPGSDPAPAPGTEPAEAPRGRSGHGFAAALRWLLAASLLLYGLQAAWSIDLDNAGKQAAFFFVPFAVMFRVLLEVRWDARLLRWVFGILVVEALAFVAVGFWEYQARELLWNPKVLNSNQFESFFRVNSVFWDPNIYGRFLALVMVAVAGFMAWARRDSRVVQAALVLAILWGGLVLTFSQSSFAALLGGLTVLAALRWSARWTAVGAVVLAVGAIAFVAGFGDTVKLNLGSAKSLDRATSGRVELIEGGLDLAIERPAGGHGSGSFARAYLRSKGGGEREAVSASHTEPVTVAAEQGILGLGVYVALIAAAIATLLAGLRSVMPGLGAGRPRGEGVETVTVARAVLAAAFGAILFHTLAYAAFLTDPATWAVLAVGASLAGRATAGD